MKAIFYLNFKSIIPRKHNIMKTNIISSMLVCAAFSSCISVNAQKTIVPSKNYITQKVKVEAFDGILAATSIDVVYTQADHTDIEVYAPDNLMEYVKVENDGKMLKIHFDTKRMGNQINIRGKHDTKVSISAPAVHALHTSSSGDILLMNGLKTNGEVNIQASSAGEIKGSDVSCEELVVEASSAGDIELKNVICSTLKVEASSAGDIEIEALEAKKVAAEASSSGDVSLDGACRLANLESSSAGDIDADGLKAQEVVAVASSSGDVSCHAVELLEATTSNAGNVCYKGNPKQIINHSKGLKKIN